VKLERKLKRYLRKKHLAERYSCHVRSIERMIKDGRPPKPQYTMGYPMWAEDDIEANERAAAMRATKPAMLEDEAGHKHRGEEI
jgi:hypothetical protein